MLINTTTLFYPDRVSVDDPHPAPRLPLLRGQGHQLRAHLPAEQLQVPDIRRRSLRRLSLWLYDATRECDPQSREPVCG